MRRHAAESVMKQKIDLATASMALGVAGYMAVILDYLARNELSLSGHQIRPSAVLAAVLISVALGAASLREKAARRSDPSPKR
jgi:hypothetical protein